MWLMWILLLCSDFVGSPCTRTACGSAGPSLGRGWSLGNKTIGDLLVLLLVTVIHHSIEKCTIIIPYSTEITPTPTFE